MARPKRIDPVPLAVRQSAAGRIRAFLVYRLRVYSIEVLGPFDAVLAHVQLCRTTDFAFSRPRLVAYADRYRVLAAEILSDYARWADVGRETAVPAPVVPAVPLPPPSKAIDLSVALAVATAPRVITDAETLAILARPRSASISTPTKSTT